MVAVSLKKRQTGSRPRNQEAEKEVLLFKQKTAYEINAGDWSSDVCSSDLLEKTLESPLDCKEIQPVHSEGDQPWDFFGRNDAKAETPVLWPPHAKS